MRELQITCIKKIPRFAKNENVKYIGNSKENWRRGRDDVLTRIESKQESYYIIHPETKRKSSIGVIHEEGKPPYLRSYIDGVWNDDLLYLEECPDDCIVLL